MGRVLLLSSTLAITSLVQNQIAQAQPVHRCDVLAASPEDPRRVSPAVDSKVLANSPKPAIEACTEAVRLYPAEPRFEYQLARGLFAQNRRDPQVLTLMESAARKGYPVAMYGLGALHLFGTGGATKDYAVARRHLQEAKNLGVEPMPSKLMATLDEAEKAEHAKAEAERKKQEAETKAKQDAAKAKQEAESPQGKLKDVYSDYISMQACFESRKEYTMQYVTAGEMDRARSITKREEGSLLRAHPALVKQKDQIWEEAKKEFLGTMLATFTSTGSYVKDAHTMCGLVKLRYVADRAEQGSRIKKDF